MYTNKAILLTLTVPGCSSVGMGDYLINTSWELIFLRITLYSGHIFSFSLQNSILWHLFRHARSTSFGSETSFFCCPCLLLIKERATCKNKDSLFLQWGKEEEKQPLAFLLPCQSQYLVWNVCLKCWIVGYFIFACQRLSVGLLRNSVGGLSAEHRVGGQRWARKGASVMCGVYFQSACQ